MKSKSAVCALAALALGAGSLAQAQTWRHGDYRGEAQAPHQRHWQGQRGQQWQGQRHWQGQAHGQPYSQGYYAPQHRQYSSAPRYYGAPQYHARSYGPRYWAGGYLPHEYRSHRYWVADWHARRLAPPPHGYQWVETDAGELLLVALPSGVIAGAILAP